MSSTLSFSSNILFSVTFFFMLPSITKCFFHPKSTTQVFFLCLLWVRKSSLSEHGVCHQQWKPKAPWERSLRCNIHPSTFRGTSGQSNGNFLRLFCFHADSHTCYGHKHLPITSKILFKVMWNCICFSFCLLWLNAVFATNMKIETSV